MTRGGKRPGAGRPRVHDNVNRLITLRKAYWKELEAMAVEGDCSVHEVLRQLVRAGYTPENKHDALMAQPQHRACYMEIMGEMACLDGTFTADELTAIAAALRKIQRTKAGKALLK